MVHIKKRERAVGSEMKGERGRLDADGAEQKWVVPSWMAPVTGSSWLRVSH